MFTTTSTLSGNNVALHNAAGDAYCGPVDESAARGRVGIDSLQFGDVVEVKGEALLFIVGTFAGGFEYRTPGIAGKHEFVGVGSFLHVGREV